MPVVCGGLVELLAQFEWDIGVLEGTLRLHDHFVPILLDDYCGFCHIPDLSCGKAHTCESMESKNYWCEKKRL